MSALDHLKPSSGRRLASSARRNTQSVERSRPFRWLVRAGFIARGITYGVVGGVALAIALGAGGVGVAPNQQGALALIARTSVGRPALVVIAAGLLAYALWKMAQGVLGRGPEGGGGPGALDRAGNIGGGVVYLIFFAVAIRVLTGSAGSSSAAPKQAAGGVLSWPGGQLIVGIGGLALIVISLYQLYDALRGGFLNDTKTERMNGRERRLFLSLGRIGLSARALVFLLIGYFLLRTATDSNSSKAIGVDGALARLHHEPLGPWLVGLVAAGLVIFAAFTFFEARYRRL